MAFENELLKHTMKTGADLSSLQYHAVSLEGGVQAVSGVGGVQESGILLNKPQSGEFAEVAYLGVIKYKAGGTITEGARLAVNSGGSFAVGGSGDMLTGKAIHAVDSGGIGSGIFNFITPVYAFSSSFAE